MSSLRVTAEPLTIHPHPAADALELAQVGLFRAVVAKGIYRTGDYAVYIPEQAVLPAGLIDELGLTGRLAGAEKNRVKAIRLRGELSQGIVCRPGALVADLAAAHADGTDFAAALGITKWVPPVPATMSGDAEPAPDLLPWVDIENLRRYPDVFADGEEVVVTEKVHGSCCLFTYYAADGGIQVSSKGVGAAHLALVEDARNLYWRAARAFDLPAVAERLAQRLGASRVGVFGEVFGDGVQDLTYGADVRRGETGFVVFDLSYDDGTGVVRWLDPQEWLAGELPLVPQLYTGPFAHEKVLELAEGRETLSGRALHIREGVVVRPRTERASVALGGSRAIAKVINPAYLTRKGGTEFE
ncbi:RNA ligase (ATP) [Streptacidiphilus jiangxiensis]|uniref:RNA ligase, DRB0094 family n=1 Tax=Streptacidiphilus jiangxiensis TaxID=235985 RepID=A0A1H7I1N6_STRJI|nr:RNA ligase (ATP) [Streptacidiphilus jiangxiensis]SEK54405.1 RNA ligase, DRB0094 family [Streptacidiphilus jiangxiensis]